MKENEYEIRIYKKKTVNFSINLRTVKKEFAPSFSNNRLSSFYEMLALTNERGDDS